MPKRVRVGVDVGGTFTDFVLVDDHRGLIFTGKRLTTPDDPSRAVTDGLAPLLGLAELGIGRVDAVVHGTTLIANAVIERKGAKVGLITTKGFRDSLEMGREIRYDLYDLFFERAEPLVPRTMRREVAERIDAAGTVLKPMDEKELRAVARGLAADGVEAIAVAFLHAYRNDAHEKRAKAIIERECPGIPVTLSSEVAPEIREFERTSTACTNAYVQPLTARYLGRLEQKLAGLGLKGTLSIMHSAGGITTVRAARRFPVQVIESGPAAGAMAAAYYARLVGAPSVISFDMGGTTAKMCLVEDGAPERAHEFESGRVKRFRKGSGLPLKVPVVDLIEIGAGGGSIAWIDPMGLLKVGPESSGADPGPVCYGQGGRHPTVTDADLLLGYLSPDFFLGGEMKLDVGAVEAAIADEIAGPLGLSVTEAAAGIHSIVNENMAAATRMYIAEKGRDPRRYTMIAFGGAGPVHAYGFAKLLKLKRVVCPLGAGVLSALGFLVAAPAIDLVRSYVARLDTLDWAHVNGLLEAMQREARALLVEAGAGAAEISFRRSADMRYVGQGFEIGVPVPAGRLHAGALETMMDSFAATYQQVFERRIEGVPVEALTWRLHAAAPAPELALNFAGRNGGAGTARKGTRRVHFQDSGYVTCPVYDRYALKPGDSIPGPAVVEERESTAVAGPDARLSVDGAFNLVIEIGAGGVDGR